MQRLDDGNALGHCCGVGYGRYQGKGIVKMNNVGRLIAKERSQTQCGGLVPDGTYCNGREVYSRYIFVVVPLADDLVPAGLQQFCFGREHIVLAAGLLIIVMDGNDLEVLFHQQKLPM